MRNSRWGFKWVDRVVGECCLVCGEVQGHDDSDEQWQNSTRHSCQFSENRVISNRIKCTSGSFWFLQVLSLFLWVDTKNAWSFFRCQCTPVATGALVGLAHPNNAPNPPNEIWDTMDQYNFCQFLEYLAPCTNVELPYRRLSASVSVENRPFCKAFFVRSWYQSLWINLTV